VYWKRKGANGTRYSPSSPRPRPKPCIHVNLRYHPYKKQCIMTSVIMIEINFKIFFTYKYIKILFFIFKINKIKKHGETTPRALKGHLGPGAHNKGRREKCMLTCSKEMLLDKKRFLYSCTRTKIIFSLQPRRSFHSLHFFSRISLGKSIVFPLSPSKRSLYKYMMHAYTAQADKGTRHKNKNGGTPSRLPLLPNRRRADLLLPA